MPAQVIVPVAGTDVTAYALCILGTTVISATIMAAAMVFTILSVELLTSLGQQFAPFFHTYKLTLCAQPEDFSRHWHCTKESRPILLCVHTEAAALVEVG